MILDRENPTKHDFSLKNSKFRITWYYVKQQQQTYYARKDSHDHVLLKNFIKYAPSEIIATEF